MIQRIIMIMVLVCLACPAVWADEVMDLKKRVAQLEAENKTLRTQLGTQKDTASNAVVMDHVMHKTYEEKSVAGFLGLAPEKESFVKGGFIDLNYYYDDRDFNVMTVNLLANLPADIQYFSLTNFSSTNDSNGTQALDLSDYYMEHHFRRPIAKDHPWLYPLDWTIQYVDGSGVKDLVRLGTRVRFADIDGWVGDFFKEKLGIWYNVDFHWYESDGEGYEIEHAYGGSYWDGLITIGGFMDHDFDNVGENTIVSENQIGLRLIDKVYYVTEFKYSHNRAKGDRWGTAFGLEYIIPF